MDGPVIYAILTRWPTDDQLALSAPSPSTQTVMSWVGYHGENLVWRTGTNGGIVATLPKVSLAHVPCQWAWVFRLTKLLNAAGG